MPHPNTYYAKVSTDRLSEVAAGLRYTKSYLMQPEHIGLFLLATLTAGIADAALRAGNLQGLLITACFFHHCNPWAG